MSHDHVQAQETYSPAHVWQVRNQGQGMKNVSFC
jgi:hypothetical protein